MNKIKLTCSCGAIVEVEHDDYLSNVSTAVKELMPYMKHHEECVKKEVPQEVDMIKHMVNWLDTNNTFPFEMDKVKYEVRRVENETKNT